MGQYEHPSEFPNEEDKKALEARRIYPGRLRNWNLVICPRSFTPCLGPVCAWFVYSAVRARAGCAVEWMGQKALDALPW